ncbi:MAG: Fe-S cluster assembly protein HesB [Ilumatobacter sp.]|nr:Fe-S cluster assembly protein HesB [Ilumatobacter sp.]
MAGTLYITGDTAADKLLNTNANALLLGMLLDQQVPMEWAFQGPATLKSRLGHLDPKKIAAMDQDEFVSICCEKPAIHRFPGSMGKRVHQVCTALTDEYKGSAANIWKGVDSGADLFRRLKALPGFGDEKSKIFVALLAKTQGIAPDGWREAAGKFGDDTPRSVADVVDDDSLGKVRDWKKAQKAAKKDKQDRPLS